MLDFLRRTHACLKLEELIVPGAEAVETVMRLHQERRDNHAFIEGPVTKHPPFYEPDYDPGKYASLWVRYMRRASVRKMLEAAENISPAAWVVEQEAGDRHFREKMRRELSPEDFAEEEEAEAGRHEPWPEDHGPLTGYAAILFLDPHKVGSIEVAEQVRIAFSPAPVARWWETFAHTRFGSVNARPHPEVHVALGREWAASHGARLIALTGDTVEYSIAKPIATREEALRMSDIHNHYCPDNIQQNWGTFERYAATLLNAPVWSFWWD
jgi:hypothetical protein